MSCTQNGYDSKYTQNFNAVSNFTIFVKTILYKI